MDVPAGTVANLLGGELQAVRAFVALLAQEQKQLTEGRIDNLTQLAGEKNRLTQELTRYSGAREAILKAAGLPIGRTGMEAWLETPAGSPGRESWRQILEFAAKARTLNETNGKLVNLRLQHNQDALTVLRAAAERAETYGPDGQQKTGTGSRSLGSA